MTRALGAWVWLLLGHGCGLVIDFEPEVDESDGGVLDAAPDAGRSDAAAADAARADAEMGDGGADAGMTLDPCDATWAADGLIAVYEIDYNLLDSIRRGAPDGFFEPNADAMPWWPSPCGATALGFYGMDYAVLPHWESWYGVQSVDFWLHVPDVPDGQRPRGVLSRDANTHGMGGHLTIGLASTERITVRLQSSLATREEDMRCSPALSPDEWVHVGVNVAPLELWVNGRLWDVTGVDRTAENLGSLGCSDHVRDPEAVLDLCCTNAPWVVGGSSQMATEGTTDIVGNLLGGGALDRLRFSTVRRDFSAASR